MKICTLSSGSKGNCTYVESGSSAVLIDQGLSLRELEKRAAGVGLDLTKVRMIAVTHEHTDHISGLDMLTKKHGTKVVAPRTVAARLRGMLPGVEDYIEVIRAGESFHIGEAEVRAFRTLHDTDESVGYRIEAESSFGLCTDLGCLTDEVLEAMSGVELAVIESNYDERMLCDGPYPVYLKRRILSGHGHLSNDEAGKLAVHLARNGAQSLILGHLSRENNRPELALNAVRTALREAGETMPGLTFIFVGRMRERHYTAAFEEYFKRLGAFGKPELREIAEERLPEQPSEREIAQALKREAAEILKAVPKGAYTVALCVEGKAMSSEELAQALEGQARLCFIIGGSFGLDESVKAAADLRLSMSRMTFPHHLARVMLAEQVYRAFTIQNGGRYHK